MIRPRPRADSRRPGAATVEFAVCLPVMLTMLMGIWEFGRVIQLQQIVNNAAREGARQAATGKYTIAQVRQNVLDYLSNANLKIVDSSNNPNVAVTVANNTTGGEVFDCQQLDQIQVDVKYPFANARWIALNYFTVNTSSLNATAIWRGLTDVPVSIPTTIPAGPSS